MEHIIFAAVVIALMFICLLIGDYLRRNRKEETNEEKIRKMFSYCSVVIGEYISFPENFRGRKAHRYWNMTWECGKRMSAIYDILSAESLEPHVVSFRNDVARLGMYLMRGSVELNGSYKEISDVFGRATVSARGYFEETDKRKEKENGR